MSDCFAIQRTTVLCTLLFIHTISANCKNKGKHITLKRNFMLIPVQIFNTEFCFFKISESEPEEISSTIEATHPLFDQKEKRHDVSAQDARRPQQPGFLHVL